MKFKKYLTMIVSIIAIITITIIAPEEGNANVWQPKEYLVRTDFRPPLLDPCVGPGDRCTYIRTVLTIDPFSATSQMGGLMLDFPFGDFTHEATPDPEFNVTPYTVVKSSSNYLFPENFKIKIINSDQYPQLNGLELNVGGMQTDANGILHYFLP